VQAVRRNARKWLSVRRIKFEGDALLGAVEPSQTPGTRKRGKMICGELIVRLAVIVFFLAIQAAGFGADNRFALGRSQDEFGMRSHGIVERLGDGRTKFYPLPESTAEEYMRLRPGDAKLNPVARTDYQRSEVPRYLLEVVDRIRREGGSLRLDTKNGYALLAADGVQRFGADGRAMARFPPRPTKW
jgi:hypothetical protein